MQYWIIREPIGIQMSRVLTVQAPAKLGRPFAMSHDERRRRILDAAQALFGQTGYVTVSMADIARRCEMSKKTLYEVFADKGDLFAALVADQESFPPDEEPVAPDRATGETLEATLLSIARHVLSDRNLVVSRLVIAESAKAPELSRHLYEQGILRGKMLLSAQIESLARQNPAIARIGPPEAVGDILVGATIATFLLAAMALCQKPDMNEVEKRIASVVAAFVSSGSVV